MCEFCFWGRMRWLYISAINLKRFVFRLQGKVLEAFLPNVAMVKSPVQKYLLPCFPCASTELRLIAAHKTCMQMKCHQIQTDSTFCLKYVIMWLYPCMYLTFKNHHVGQPSSFIGHCSNELTTFGHHPREQRLLIEAPILKHLRQVWDPTFSRIGINTQTLRVALLCTPRQSYCRRHHFHHFHQPSDPFHHTFLAYHVIRASDLMKRPSFCRTTWKLTKFVLDRPPKIQPKAEDSTTTNKQTMDHGLSLLPKNRTNHDDRLPINCTLDSNNVMVSSYQFMEMHSEKPGTDIEWHLHLWVKVYVHKQSCRWHPQGKLIQSVILQISLWICSVWVFRTSQA